MRFRAILGILGIALAAYAIGAQGRSEPKSEMSPHADAIELVLQTQQARIREADRENWLHDVKDRTWVVQRFFPGVLDSTHLFHISYRIDGKEVAAWSVDTYKRVVQPIEIKIKRP